MFKSLFTKYIAVFMLIIVVSFAVLAFTVCSMVSTYALATNEDIVYRVANSSGGYLEEEFSAYKRETFGLGEFKYFVTNNEDEIRSVFNSLINITGEGDTVLVVADSEGKMLLTHGGEEGTIIGDLLPLSFLKTLENKGVAESNDSLGGVYSGSFINRGLVVRDNSGNTSGYIIASVASSWISDLNEVIMKTVIMSSLWVLIAALIAVYYLTERVIGPMRRMSNAAKKFSQGHFDVRVPVQGHDEVAELATAFNNMAASLEKLEDLRSTFLANVSHDLRTPMTTISGFVDGIIDGTITPDRQGYYLEIISAEVKRLSRLVSSLLDLSRIQAGDRKFVPVPFDICEMGRQILISFENQIDTKRLDVEFDVTDDRMMAYADKDAVHQVFYNLCHNAIKFSREGGSYRISILDEDKKIKVRVYNEGQGIPLEDIPFVFERFYKSDKSRGLDKSGAGLGLFIAKTIMNAHGEDLSVDSVYGEYCEFSFTLKYATPAQLAQVEKPRGEELE